MLLTVIYRICCRGCFRYEEDTIIRIPTFLWEEHSVIRASRLSLRELLLNTSMTPVSRLYC